MRLAISLPASMVCTSLVPRPFVGNERPGYKARFVLVSNNFCKHGSFYKNQLLVLDMKARQTSFLPEAQRTD